MESAPQMNPVPPDPQQILGQALVSLAEVLGLLEAERAALDQRDPAALLAASQRKALAIARTSALENLRRALPQPLPAALADRVAELRSLARRCRELNDANGALIRGQRRRVEHALRVLVGGDAGVEVYGRDGGARIVRGGRAPLASY